MRHSALLAFLLTAPVLSSCATYKPPLARTFETERVFSSSYDSVWAAIIAIVGESGCAIRTLEKDSGILVLERMNAAGSCDCGVPGSFQTFDQMICDVNIIATRSGSGTSVRINVKAQGLLATFTGNQYQPKTFQWISCVSNGSIERSLLDAIGSRANAGVSD